MTKYPRAADQSAADPGYIPPATSTRNWIDTLLQHTREEAVSQFINELDKIPGPIYHSDLERIKRELGYIE